MKTTNAERKAVTRRKTVAAVAGLVLLVLIIAVFWIEPADRETGEAPPPAHAEALSPVERGRALVLLADCKPCHTARGGPPFAGGRAIPTPFGTFYSPNITPDPQTGIGRWSEEDFWRALHNGYSRDGRALYPVFPYPNYTKISRADAAAMYAYLKTVQPVRRARKPHDLRFPYDQRALLTLWRRLYFRPGVYRSDPSRSAQWNRGAYLVQGIAHCSACHEARNALGASRSGEPAGGLVLSWYAPSLTIDREAGLHHWSETEIVSFLQTGRTPAGTPPSRYASAMGPMAEVIYESLQYASPDDLEAMAVYLKSLPQRESRAARAQMLLPQEAIDAIMESGREIYAEHCADCHGERGEGNLPAAPPLAGNRAVTMSSTVNPVRVVLYGGYPPGTRGNPRPFGMPPFAPTLSDTQIADVLSYVRRSWGNDGDLVTPETVARNRTGPLW